MNNFSKPRIDERSRAEVRLAVLDQLHVGDPLDGVGDAAAAHDPVAEEARLFLLLAAVVGVVAARGATRAAKVVPIN